MSITIIAMAAKNIEAPIRIEHQAGIKGIKKIGMGNESREQLRRVERAKPNYAGQNKEQICKKKRFGRHSLKIKSMCRKMDTYQNAPNTAGNSAVSQNLANWIKSTKKTQCGDVLWGDWQTDSNVVHKNFV